MAKFSRHQAPKAVFWGFRAHIGGLAARLGGFCAMTQAGATKVNKSHGARVFASMPSMSKRPLFSPAWFCKAGSGIAAVALLALAPGCDKGSSAAKKTETPQAESQPQPHMQARSASQKGGAAEVQDEAEAIAAQAPQSRGSLALEEPCSSGSQCQSGICEGLGCDDSALGKCVSEERPCTYDLVPYCGCDGNTFQSSGVCAGQRYKHKGACENSEQEPAQ